MQSNTGTTQSRLRFKWHLSRLLVLIFVSVATLFEAEVSQARIGRGRQRGQAFPPYAQWRSGYWFHGAYMERNGWWWVAGPNWYYYNSPVYPYPPMGAEPVYVVDSIYARPPAALPAPNLSTATPTGPQQSPQQAPPAPSQAAGKPSAFSYYCQSSKAYYPTTRSCSEGWIATPVTAPPN